MVIIAAYAGWRIAGTPWALFIDTRDTWSLTKFQLGLWTFAIIPVLIAFVLSRATKDPATAWDISVPGELWAVMGIALGSSSLSIAIKSQKNGDPTDADAAALAAGDRILTRVSASKARFFDMLTYDEGAAALKRIDVTKFQAFVFTIALVTTFLWNALWLFAKAKSPVELSAIPGFNQTAVGVLGVSHAGYLVAKAIPQNGTPVIAPGGGTELATAKFR